jgi:hypothetical protein
MAEHTLGSAEKARLIYFLPIIANAAACTAASKGMNPLFGQRSVSYLEVLSFPVS